MVDYLVKNKVTHSAGLIEIKTPSTRLLGGEYRDGVYSVSPELSGAVLQVLNYRESLLRQFAELTQEGDLGQLDPFDPQCTVIVGHARKELKSKARRRSFEMFRHQLSDVEVITFDEMFERTRRLVEVLEGGSQAPE